MELCKGFQDWLECTECPHLCTKLCPIENENVIEEMKRQISLLSVSGKANDKRAFGK